MEKCECWHCGTCLGTKECEECTCNGDTTKCNFYPEKRKEKKVMNTAEMWITAQENGKTYKCNGMQYNKKKGFHGPVIGLWPAKAFDYVDDIFNLDWQLKPDNEMTKSEAEAKFNIKIIGD